MLQLNLRVYDKDGNIIPALCVDGAVPQQINSLLSFLQDGMSFSVDCVKSERPSQN